MGGRLVAALILVSTFGCLAATILYCARLYLPMAQDGLFFSCPGAHPSALPHARREPRGPGRVEHRPRLSGTFEQLYT